MDELEQRRRNRRFQRDPIGELTRDMERHLRDLIGQLTQARQRRTTFWTFWAAQPLGDLVQFPLVYACNSALGLSTTGAHLAGYAVVLIALRVALRFVLHRRARRSPR